MRFVDTNVLLYAISTDSREQSKARIALSIPDETDLALSVQVLQEFYVQATPAEAGTGADGYWDAAVIEAARAADCRLVLSEDLSDRQDYGGIQVHNPFGKSSRQAAKRSGEA